MSDSPNTWQSGIGYAIALVDKMRRRESPGEVEKIDALGEVLERLERKRDKRGTEDATEVLVKAWDGEAELVSLRAQVAALRAAGEAMAELAARHRGCSDYCDLPCWGPDGDEDRPSNIEPCDGCQMRAALTRWREVAPQK